MTDQSERLPWYEPDGSPTTVGHHEHHAVWDHEGRKWDAVHASDQGERLRERAISALLYPGSHDRPQNEREAEEWVAGLAAPAPDPDLFAAVEALTLDLNYSAQTLVGFEKCRSAVLALIESHSTSREADR